MEILKTKKIDRRGSLFIPRGEDTKYEVLFNVSTSKEKVESVIEVSYEVSFHGRQTTRVFLDIPTEQSQILWMKQDHKKLQKLVEKKRNMYINFKKIMEMYSDGGKSSETKNWFVRFLSKHDYEIINQIERENHSSFMDECGGGCSFDEDGVMISTEKERPEDFEEWNDLKKKYKK